MRIFPKRKLIIRLISTEQLWYSAHWAH